MTISTGIAAYPVRRYNKGFWQGRRGDELGRNRAPIHGPEDRDIERHIQGLSGGQVTKRKEDRFIRGFSRYFLKDNTITRYEVLTGLKTRRISFGAHRHSRGSAL